MKYTAFLSPVCLVSSELYFCSTQWLMATCLFHTMTRFSHNKGRLNRMEKIIPSCCHGSNISGSQQTVVLQIWQKILHA